MSDLLSHVLEASGGTARWRDLTTISARIDYGGPFWELKGHPAFAGVAQVDADVQAERIRHRHESTGVVTEYDKIADRVTVTAPDGSTEVLDHPRKSLHGAALETPWTAAQTAYFRGYATWHYLVEPYLFTLPGVETQEVEPWIEDGAKWRVLSVAFPPSIDTHNTTQRYYFDEVFHLRRMDYQPEVVGFSPTAHYILEETEVDGIVVPTRRSIHRRNEDGTADRSFAVITLDLTDLALR
ncbi:hypothetical protein [Micromonospora sp. CB01531]|uniref:hypothetical protein n=1 Tax=Micromonospora sp. CB01531 TaxID=1718947 RepID=UPI00093F9646|nr:hypothetical protein [Micromonospora sp. CB01531]OKI84549.1 hypothetical protein A6A27_40405 [Micromonospora sp. CB01531]